MSLSQSLIQAVSGWPPELATLILAMVPVGELRVALPVAITVYKLPVWSAVFWSLIGNILPVYFLLVFFEQVSNWLRQRSPLADRFFSWLFERTRLKLQGSVEKYGVWALALFVGIPLPITGAWTGSLAAFVFGLHRGRAFFAILLGVMIAAIIVTAVTLGALASLKALL